MNRLLASLAFVFAVSMSADLARAQLPFSNVPAQRPQLSPYLNLLNRNGQGGVSDYFTQVRPQIEARNELNRQQAEITRLQRQVSQPRTSGIPPGGSREIRGTGHDTYYMNYLNFYTMPRRQ
jgi:hypothetical protein